VNKLAALLKMSNRRNFEEKALFITYLITVVIILVIGCIIGALAVLNPMVANPETPPEEISFAYMTILLCMMTIAVGICYSVMLAVPMTKDKANGNIESMLAASANIKDIWIAKTIALFLISLIAALVLVIPAALILKIACIPSEVTLTLNPWFLLTTFVSVPVMYLCECFLITIIALCFSAEAGNVIGAVFCPAMTILTINLVAKKALDPGTPILFLIHLALGAVMLVVSILLYRKVDKEKVVLSCKAAGTTTRGKRRPIRAAKA